jgi:hypothetical protein
MAQAPWEDINEAFKSEINSPANAALWEQNMVNLREARDAVCAGISETGSAEEGLARAYAWLNNGVDETTFMSNTLPSLRKFIQSKYTPEEMAKSIKLTVMQFGDSMKKGGPQAQAQLGPAFAIFEQLQAQVEEPGFLEGILSQPPVKQVTQSFGKAYEQKLPIILHHCFRFCDINSDHGVSSDEMKVLFALKDSIASGKLEQAAVHIFDVIDKDGSGEVTPPELLSFFSKFIHFICSMQRICISLIFENLVPEIIKAALPAVCGAVGLTEVSKEQLPGVMMMAQMQMAQAQGMAMQMVAPTAADAGYPGAGGPGQTQELGPDALSFVIPVDSAYDTQWQVRGSKLYIGGLRQVYNDHISPFDGGHYLLSVDNMGASFLRVVGNTRTVVFATVDFNVIGDNVLHFNGEGSFGTVIKGKNLLASNDGGTFDVQKCKKMVDAKDAAIAWLTANYPQYDSK